MLSVSLIKVHVRCQGKDQQPSIRREAISERMIRALFNSNHCNITIIQCYSPTNDAEAIDKDDWYVGDMNAKFGSDYTNRERAMEKYGCGKANDNGECLIYFCLNNTCVIGGIIFPHKDIHNFTWKSPDSKTVDRNDHITINDKWCRSLLDVRTYRGADTNSNHLLITARIKLKLRRIVKQQCQRKSYVIDIYWQVVEP